MIPLSFIDRKKCAPREKRSQELNIFACAPRIQPFITIGLQQPSKNAHERSQGFKVLVPLSYHTRVLNPSFQKFRPFGPLRLPFLSRPYLSLPVSSLRLLFPLLQRGISFKFREPQGNRRRGSDSGLSPPVLSKRRKFTSICKAEALSLRYGAWSTLSIADIGPRRVEQSVRL